MYHRFELYIDGEYQGCGIFQGMSELDMDDDDLNVLTEKFDDLLNIPLSVYSKSKNTTAWFTEKGYQHFKNEIGEIVKAYEKAGLFDVRHIIKDLETEDIVYQDEFQVVLKTL